MQCRQCTKSVFSRSLMLVGLVVVEKPQCSWLLILLCLALSFERSHHPLANVCIVPTYYCRFNLKNRLALLILCPLDTAIEQKLEGDFRFTHVSSFSEQLRDPHTMTTLGPFTDISLPNPHPQSLALLLIQKKLHFMEVGIGRRRLSIAASARYDSETAACGYIKCAYWLWTIRTFKPT